VKANKNQEGHEENAQGKKGWNESKKKKKQYSLKLGGKGEKKIGFEGTLYLSALKGCHASVMCGGKTGTENGIKKQDHREMTWKERRIQKRHEKSQS